MFTITKIAPNNFSHFDGFKEMNFSNWEINFNNTTNTIILQLRNGAPFPKKEVLASEVIIKDGIDGTPETFSTTEQIRTRLLALNYNPLVVSGGGGGAVDSVNGQTGVVVLDADDVGAIPIIGTTAGNPITGKLQTDSVTALSSTQSDMYIGIANNSDLEDTSTHAQIQFSSSEHSKTTNLTNTSPTGVNVTLTIQASDPVEGFESIIKVFSNDPLFRGLSGNQDFTPNITDLDYTQKKYVDTKAPLNPRVQSVTSSATVTPTSTNDIVTITAQAVALTLANPTGTFAEGQALMIRIKDNGTAQAITFGSNYRAIGVTLPTTTIANKILYLGIIYDSIDAKWNILGTPQQA